MEPQAPSRTGAIPRASCTSCREELHSPTPSPSATIKGSMNWQESKINGNINGCSWISHWSTTLHYPPLKRGSTFISWAESKSVPTTLAPASSNRLLHSFMKSTNQVIDIILTCKIFYRDRQQHLYSRRLIQNSRSGVECNMMDAHQSLQR